MANILYRKQKEQVSYDNGQTWIDTGNFREGEVLENPSNCEAIQYRWIELDASEGYYCQMETYNKFTVEVEEVSTDGIIWNRTGNQRQGETVIETNSVDCGYNSITTESGTTTHTTISATTPLNISDSILSGYSKTLFAVHDNKYYFKSNGTNTNVIKVYDIINKEFVYTSESITSFWDVNLYDLRKKINSNTIVIQKANASNCYLFNLDTYEITDMTSIGGWINETEMIIEEDSSTYYKYNILTDELIELENVYEITTNLTLDEDLSHENLTPTKPAELFVTGTVAYSNSGAYPIGSKVYVQRQTRGNPADYVYGDDLFFSHGHVYTETERENLLVLNTGSFDVAYKNGLVYINSDTGYYNTDVSCGFENIIFSSSYVYNMNNMEKIFGSGDELYLFPNYRFINYNLTKIYNPQTNTIKTYNDVGEMICGCGYHSSPNYFKSIFLSKNTNPYMSDNFACFENYNGFFYDNKYYCCDSINVDGVLCDEIENIYLNTYDNNLIVFCRNQDSGESYMFDIPFNTLYNALNAKLIEYN